MISRLKKLWQYEPGLVGCSVAFLGIATICFLGGLLIPHDPHVQNLPLGPTSPSLEYWLGTDSLGRDLLARILQGGRVSLLIALSAAFIATSIGVTYGSISGYLGGWIDAAMMRLLDILYAIPFILLVILLMAVFGRSFWVLFIAIGSVQWLTLARIVRANIIQLKSKTFVEAAETFGQSRANILIRHLLPNLIGPVIVYSTLLLPTAILMESALSFLGLGVQPPDSSWGSLIRDGADKMVSYPWLMAFPTVFFVGTLLCLNLLGDRLRDHLDVRKL